MLNLFAKSKGILGMNARNLKYIRPYNLSTAKRLADDKLRSKRVLKKGGIPVPRLLDKIRSREELENFDFSSLPNSFVLKPNFGFGGEGILVVYGKKKNIDNVWVKANCSVVTEEDLRTHIRNILDGSYSRTDTPDIAFFEERIKLLKLFKPYAYRGIPDIRVLIFNRVPVMAMLRLPTEASGGTSNVHNGGIAVGIDMATGVTTTATQYSRAIEYVPGKRLLLSGIKIPLWRDILELAVKAYDISHLGYLGADVTLDRDLGPVFMEINARPGLAIQNANQDGLLTRLKRVEGLRVKTIARSVTLAQNLFGGEIEEEIEEISGKRIIGTVEKVKLIGRNEKEIDVNAKIDTGAELTSIDVNLAKKLGFEKTVSEWEERRIDYDELEKMSKREREKNFSGITNLVDTAIIHSSHGTTRRPMIKLKIIMDKKIIYTKVTIIDRTHLKFSIIIGKRNLGRFLIDASKY